MGSVSRVDSAVDVIEGAYVYRLDGVVLPIEETFSIAGGAWTAKRSAGGVSIAVSATVSASGRLERARVSWRSGVAVDLDVSRTADQVIWVRDGVDAEGQPSSAESRFAGDTHVFPLLRCFQGATVRTLAEAAGGRAVLVPDITDPADAGRLLTPRLDVRRATEQDDGTFRYVGGSYEDGAECEVGADGLLECYRWDQPGIGRWDVRLRRSGTAVTP